MRTGQTWSADTTRGSPPSSLEEGSGNRMMVMLEVDPSVDRSCPCGSCQKESKIWLEIPPGIQFASELLREIEHTYHLTGEHRLFFMDFFLPPTSQVLSVLESFKNGVLKIMPQRGSEGPGSRPKLPPALPKQGSQQQAPDNKAEVSTSSDSWYEMHAMRVLEIMCPELYGTLLPVSSSGADETQKNDNKENLQAGQITPVNPKEKNDNKENVLAGQITPVLMPMTPEMMRTITSTPKRKSSLRRAKERQSTPYPAPASIKRRIKEIKENPGHSQVKKAPIPTKALKITAEFSPDILAPKNKKSHNDNGETSKDDPRTQARARDSLFSTKPTSKNIIYSSSFSSESDQEN